MAKSDAQSGIFAPAADLGRLEQLAVRLDDMLVADRQPLSQRLPGLLRRAQGGQPVDRALAGIEAQIARSESIVAARKAVALRLEYPAELPIAAHAEALSELIARHQVVVIAGETGSGKTTQIPKICLALGRGIHGAIGHTQPRRIAARSVAGRIAEELGTPLGQAVGYKVRFNDHTRPESRLKLMTDGILLAELQGDPLLLAYDTLIIDEAHERSLNIDFLLGVLKQLLPKRPDLKLIVTSATIDTASFSRYFNDAPVVEVSGRGYPVEVRYRPLSDDEESRDRDLPQAVVEAVEELGGEDAYGGVPGDILVFLPGEREIREVAEALHHRKLPHCEILPLYSRLSAAEQDRVFQSHTGRRIVLATNVAETSLTVPGIRYVIDSGLARVSRYSPRSKVQRLPIESIAQAAANQRAGRCGRVAPGICIRLYGESDFNTRPAQTDPEILRTNLASVILQMAHLKLGDVEAFPFMAPPERRAVGDGYRLLFELQAMDSARRITAMGRQIARLPLDPRLARMLIAGHKEGALHELLIIVAALSVQDPKLRPHEQQAAADLKHRQFADEHSDFPGWLKLWQWHAEQSRHLSRSKLRKLCTESFLSHVRLREWHDLHGQLLGVVRELGMAPNEAPASSDAIHRALLSGLLCQIGLFDAEQRNYLGVRGLRFFLFPASQLHKKPPQWAMAAELVETSRLFARTVAPIRPEWIEQAAGHLLSRDHGEPEWSEKRGRVEASERVSLFGLTLAVRQIDYGRIDAVACRKLFIRHALVLGEMRTSGKFYGHNRQLLAELEGLEAKSRRRDLMVEEERLAEFFEPLLPASISDVRAFERWRLEAEKSNPRLLFWPRELLFGEASIDRAVYPDWFDPTGLRLRYEYHFDPLHHADGITLCLPLAQLGLLDAKRFEWLVPGMLVEKLTFLIKALPKSTRVHFVPAPRFAEAAAQAMTFGEGELLARFAAELQRIGGVAISPMLWREIELPAHLRMKFRLLGEGGKRIEEGEDLAGLQRKHAAAAQREVAELADAASIEKSGLTRWDFGALPEQVAGRRGNLRIVAFPSLVDEGKSVAIRLFERQERAAAAHAGGIRRLVLLALHQQVDLLRKQMPAFDLKGLHRAKITDATLREQIAEAAVARLFLAEPLPRDSDAFAKRLDGGRAQLVPDALRLAKSVAEILKAHAGLQEALERVVAPQRQPVAEEIRAQMAALLPADFVRTTPIAWLDHLPRFIRAAQMRLEKSGRDPLKEKQLAEQVAKLWQQWQVRAALLADGLPPQLVEFRWLIEELRVSLFAQELKTSQPVSLQRLEKRWQELLGR